MRDDSDIEASAYLPRALAALRDGRLDRAETISARALARWPNDPAAHQLSATVALTRGRFDEALAFAQACLALRPGHAPAMILAGQAARARGDLAGAKHWFAQAARIAPSDVEAHLHLALSEIAAGAPGLAAEMERLAARFPAHAELWRKIGAALAGRKQLALAQAAFERAARASQAPVHQLNLGRLLLSRGRAAEALAPLRRAFELEPHKTEALLPLAEALRRSGAPRAAQEPLRRLIAAEPEQARHYFALGLTCDDLRDWPGAIAAYARCVAIDAGMAEAHVNLGLALQQAGQTEAARASYRAAMRLRPETFAHIAQALPSGRTGELWLNMGKLRDALLREPGSIG